MCQVDVNHHGATKVYQLSLQGNFDLEILFAVLSIYVIPLLWSTTCLMISTIICPFVKMPNISVVVILFMSSKGFAHTVDMYVCLHQC